MRPLDDVESRPQLAGQFLGNDPTRARNTDVVDFLEVGDRDAFLAIDQGVLGVGQFVLNLGRVPVLLRFLESRDRLVKLARVFAQFGRLRAILVVFNQPDSKVVVSRFERAGIGSAGDCLFVGHDGAAKVVGFARVLGLFEESLPRLSALGFGADERVGLALEIGESLRHIAVAKLAQSLGCQLRSLFGLAGVENLLDAGYCFLCRVGSSHLVGEPLDLRLHESGVFGGLRFLEGGQGLGILVVGSEDKRPRHRGFVFVVAGQRFQRGQNRKRVRVGLCGNCIHLARSGRRAARRRLGFTGRDLFVLRRFTGLCATGQQDGKAEDRKTETNVDAVHGHAPGCADFRAGPHGRFALEGGQR